MLLGSCVISVIMYYRMSSTLRTSGRCLHHQVVILGIHVPYLAKIIDLYILGSIFILYVYIGSCSTVAMFSIHLQIKITHDMVS